ncbi:hypothetical protein BDZ91DRAFT_680725 [Kalaharituber pfeilii]|nr:hypothetical protein BDZ91DRAFT_680725 [Kalaharituber pfeilii]
MSSSLGHLPTESTIAARLSSSPSAPTPPALPTAASAGANSDLGNTRREEASDSEAETIVLPVRKRRNGDGSRGRNRRGSSADGDAWESDSSARRSKRHRKRREADVYSSELSSAPSAPSSPVRGLNHVRGVRGRSPAAKLQYQRPSLSRKRKAPGDAEHDDGNSNAQSTHSPRRNSRSSPFSLSPPPTSNRTRAVQTSTHSPAKPPHKVKQRKVPRPLSNTRDKRSSDDRSPSSSRQGSPSSVPPLLRPSAARTPGSPAHTVSMPHKPKRDASGRTLLHRAAQRGILEEVIQIYNQNKELLNAEDNAGYIPLHEASLNGNTEVVRFLLASGSWVDVQSSHELDTPLMDAVENGHLEVVKLLLEAGADPKMRNKSGADALECLGENTPDSEAIEAALRAALQKRKSKRSSDDENRNSATVESLSSRDPSVASPTNDTGPPTSRQGASRRRNARSDQTKNEMLWVEGGKNGLQKLREKARLGDNTIVYACLERGVEPDVESLIGAIKGGHEETVSLLLAFNANADPEPSKSATTGKRNTEETPMLAAIGRNNLKILGYLLDRVDPLRRDVRGRTYMDIARERAGDNWEKEVEMLQAAYDKAVKTSATTSAGKCDKPQKKVEPADNSTAKRVRPQRDSMRRSESIQAKKEDLGSDREFNTEPRTRQKDHRPRDSEPGSLPLVKKKRRLIPGKELLAEKNSSISKVEEQKLSKPHKESRMIESRDSHPPRFKKELKDKDIDMPDVPEVRSKRRGHSHEPGSSSIIRTAPEKPVAKMVPLEKRKNKEFIDSITSKPLKPTSVDSEKKKRKLTAVGLKERDDASSRKVRKSADIDNGRPKDSRWDELRTKRLESETRSETSGKEDEPKKAVKDSELLKARKFAKEEKRLAQEEERKQKEAERKEREEQRKEEEGRLRKALEEQECLRMDYLMSEQRNIINKAMEESKRAREEEQARKLEEERIAEEQRQAELKRLEEERRLLEEQQRLAEEKRLREEEEERERRRIAEEEEERRRLEEEARKRAEAEEKLQMELREAAERRRREEEAELQRQLEIQRQEEEARRREQEEAEQRYLQEEKRRQAEIRRREALPFALRVAAENPYTIPSLSEAAKYLPFYSNSTEPVNGDAKHNGVSKPCEWILNIQAALVLGITDLSFESYRLESREISDAHRLRMWTLLRPMLSEPVTFKSNPDEILSNQQANKEKFLRMNPLFWMKLDDFFSIIRSDARYSHFLTKGAIRTSWVDFVWTNCGFLSL